MAKPTKEQIAHLINNLNVGTNKAKLGEIFVALISRVEVLETKVAALEAKP